MPLFYQTFKTRGKRKSIKRSSLLFFRYGMRSLRMQRKLASYTILAKTLTLCVSASVLKRHPFIYQDGVDYAVHGYRHFDYSGMTRTEQKYHLQKALEVFGKFGAEQRGFRAPYLKVNKDTLELLSEMGFLYDSSCSVYWDVLPQGRVNQQCQRILEYYRPMDPQTQGSLPFFEAGLLRIPVSLPDDEMLIDRLRIRNQDQLYGIWLEILMESFGKDEMFILLLHPERFHLAGKALKKLLDKADSLGMWIASLKDIAVWWGDNKRKQRWPDDRRGVFCVTGDIDSVTLFDYFLR
jgi:peptidoglycan/xylan/chitin deacetylase (PgdA/CDA1 family)